MNEQINNRGWDQNGVFHLCMMPNCCLGIQSFSYIYLDYIRYSNNERLHSDIDQTHIIVGFLLWFCCHNSYHHYHCYHGSHVNL